MRTKRPDYYRAARIIGRRFRGCACHLIDRETGYVECPVHENAKPENVTAEQLHARLAAALAPKES